jgi:hypothetical protein
MIDQGLIEINLDVGIASTLLERFECHDIGEEKHSAAFIPQPVRKAVANFSNEYFPDLSVSL